MQKDINEMAESITATLKLMRNIDAGTINQQDFILYEIESCVWSVLSYYPFEAGEKVHFGNAEIFSFNFKIK